MSKLTTAVIELRRKLPEQLAECLDEVTASEYCKEWSRALTKVQAKNPDTRSLISATLLVTQKLNRGYQINQATRKDINQLILRTFSSQNSDPLELQEKPISLDSIANEEHIFVRFLNAVKESYDVRLGSSNQFTLEFQGRMTSMKISFDTVRVLKNWSSHRAVTPNFDEVQAKDLRTIVDNLYNLTEMQFGSTQADIILSDAILTAETNAKVGQLSIRDLL